MLWVFLAVVAVGLLWLGHRNPRRRRWLLPRRAVPLVPASAVDRQHRHLAAGGQLGEAAIAATATRFRELLRTGRTTELERELRPGVGFVLQVQALAAIGTPEAGRVLERQLARTLSRDAVEQSWYWADVASGLRRLRHAPALPVVLGCCDAAAGLPAAPILAAEAVAFPNFPTTLNDLTNPVGRAALRAVCEVARSCREGTIDTGCMLCVGIGDLLATLSETAPPIADPWLTAAMLEAQRISRRLEWWVHQLPSTVTPHAERQARRLEGSVARRKEWLVNAPGRLLSRFPAAPVEEQVVILRCLNEFRSDISRLLAHVPHLRVPWWVEAVQGLMWSRSAAIGPTLAAQAAKWINSSRNRSRAAVLISALRGHPGPETERVLVLATSAGYCEVRQAAAGALGWWPPHEPRSVLSSLRERCADADAAVRQAANAALARLGDRAALQEAQAGLSSEEPSIRACTARRIAAEELSWLWPDLELAATSADRETALAASEAVEQLRESVLGPIG